MTDDWDALADTFDDEPDHGLRDPAVRDAWWRALAPRLPAPPAAVADLACGTGSLSLLLAEQGDEVTGVDRAPRMLERAEAKAGDRAAFLLGDVSAPPLPHCSVSLATSARSTRHPDTGDHVSRRPTRLNAFRIKGSYRGRYART